MRNYKRVISSVIVFAMGLSMSGCDRLGGSGGSSRRESDNEELLEEVEEIVGDFMNYSMGGNSTNAKKLVEDRSNVVGETLDELTESQYSVYEALMDASSVEISRIRVDEDGESASARVAVTIPVINIDEFGSLDELIESIGSADSSADTRDETVIVELTGDDGDFYVTEDSAQEVIEILTASVVGQDLEFRMDPEDVVAAYIQCLADGDIDGALAYTTVRDNQYVYERYMPNIVSAYYSSLTDETYSVYEDNDFVVSVMGSMIDISQAYEIIFTQDAMEQLSAEIFYAQLNYVPDEDALIAYYSIMDNLLAENMAATDYQLVTLEYYILDIDGEYLIAYTSDIIPEPEFADDFDPVSDVDMYSVYVGALDRLIEDGRINQDEYDQLYEEVVADYAPAAEPTGEPADDPDAPDAPEVDPDADPTPTPDGDDSAIRDTNDVDGELFACSYTDDLFIRLDEFSEIECDDYAIYPSVGNEYIDRMDAALASGDGCPDVFAVDSDMMGHFVNNPHIMPLQDLGITDDELADMFPYTLEYATSDEGQLMGVTWNMYPCGVFYNRTVAQRALGVSEPEDVAPYFATWDAVLDTAYTVSEAGNYRITAGLGDMYSCYSFNRTNGWVADGQVYVDPVMDGYFDLSRVLFEDELTWDYQMWTSDWMNCMENHNTLSYWGSLWMGYILIGYSDDAITGRQPGDWGMVPSPNPWFWGGTWLMVPDYCDKQASVAQIIRDLTMNDEMINLPETYGEMPNSISAMEELAADDSASVSFLGGQNPYGMFMETALNISADGLVDNESSIGFTFIDVVHQYVNGEFATVAEAEAAFSEMVEEMYL